MDALGRFLIALYQSARELHVEAFQEHALTGLNALVPFDAARWGTGCTDERGADFHAPYLYNDSPQSMQDYNGVREYDTTPATVLARPGRTFNFALGRLACERGAFADYLHRHRHEQGLITAHESRSTGAFHSLSLYGAYIDKPFTEQQRRLAEQVFPHLRESLQTNLALCLERIRPRTEGCKWAMAICDSGGLFCFVDPSFVDMLRQEWPCTVHRALPSALTMLISATHPTSFAGRHIVFGLHVEHQMAFIRARRRLAVDSLSRRELQIAERVAAGLTHKEVAKALGISPATVRNHVQAIHERVDVRNNAGLAAQLKDARI